MSDNDPKPFRLGITLAGAVSAGAYSAGVLDFLREALEAWENAKINRKDLDGKPVPTHKVQIQAMSGTSAGAICAAMFIGALDKPLRPVTHQSTAASNAANPLYSAWVSRVDIQPMLDDDDLVSTREVKSLLNCRILDEIAVEALQPWQPTYTFPPWLAEDAEVFFCTTSLRGIPYAVSAHPTDPHPYGMSLHAGVLKYRLRSAAGIPNDDAITLAPDVAAANWDNLRSVALASGAFPFALKARETSTPRGVIENRWWEIPSSTGRTLANNVHTQLPPMTVNFPAICVDGGAINNEPMEYTRLALACPTPPTAGANIPRLKRDLADCDAATLLIDPFPDPVEFDPTFNAASDVLSVAKALLPAVLNQLRFKTDELILAASSDVASRYLISPSRPWRSDNQPTLACGALGGFMGFLKEEFRHHDYLLGRLNCQQFLKRHFYVTQANPLVADWVGQATSYVSQAYYSDQELASIQQAHPGIEPAPIIPLMPELRDEAALRQHLSAAWPSVVTQGDLKSLHRRLRNRLDAVMTRLLGQIELPVAKQLARWLLSGLASFFGINPADIAAKAALDGIRKSLETAGLLKK